MSFDKPSPSFKNIELAKLEPEFSSIQLIKLQQAELELDQYFVKPSWAWQGLARLHPYFLLYHM